MNQRLKCRSLIWISALMLSLLCMDFPRLGLSAQAKVVEVLVNTTHPMGNIDLTRYSLGQGGFTYRPMINGVIPQIAQLHPQTIRLFVQEYFNLYPAHDRYHWQALDKAIDAIEATGAKPIMNLCFKPKVLYPKIDEKLVGPTSWTEWDQLIYRLVKHCNQEKKYGIEYWEIANEPNLRDGGGTPYSFTPQQYLTFYTHIVNAIRRADSKAKVGGPALATWNHGPLLGGKSPILDALLDYCGRGNAPLDFISWHLYNNNPELFRKEITEVKAQLRKYGRLKNVETIIDEWNMSLRSPIPNPSYQPAFILDNTYGFYKGGLSRSGYYQIKDEYFDSKLFSTFMPQETLGSSEHFFNVLPIYLGLYDLQGRVRPSYYAFKLLSLIKGESLSITTSVPNIKGFAAQDKNLMHVVLWNFPAKGQGTASEVNVQFTSEISGSFHIMRLYPERPVNNLEMIRSGRMKELHHDPLRMMMHPYDVYWIEISR